MHARVTCPSFVDIQLPKAQQQPICDESVGKHTNVFVAENKVCYKYVFSEANATWRPETEHMQQIHAKFQLVCCRH